MYGAIIGDIVGSIYEFNNIKTKEFPFVSRGCSFTDDTVMTVAVARALLQSREQRKPFKPLLVREMQTLGRRFPDAGYGARFSLWLRMEDPQPYGSFGNGSAMRASPCGLIAVTLKEAVSLARASAEVTHDHPEGVRGAEATAAAVFLARTGRTKEEIGEYIRSNYYDLSWTLDEIRPSYRFNETCPGTVPQALEAFLESNDFEDAIRNAVSLGGDSDTLAAIAGSVAWSYYRFHGPQYRDTHKKEGRIWPESCDRIVEGYGIDAMLPEDFVRTIDDMDVARVARGGTYDRTGFCPPIPVE